MEKSLCGCEILRGPIMPDGKSICAIVYPREFKSNLKEVVTDASAKEFLDANPEILKTWAETEFSYPFPKIQKI